MSGGWNYRVMRAFDKPHPSVANTEAYYAIYEVFYNDDDTVKSWTEDPCGSPFGATMDEMVSDLAWIMTVLVKPVLDHATGKDVEPAKLLVDDLYAMLNKNTNSPSKPQTSVKPGQDT